MRAVDESVMFLFVVYLVKMLIFTLLHILCPPYIYLNDVIV